MRKTQALTIGLSHPVLKKKLFRNRNNLVSSSPPGPPPERPKTASKVSRCIPPADFRLHERVGAVEGGGDRLAELWRRQTDIRRF